MHSPNDPGSFREHQCAGCSSTILRGQLCSDCQRKVDERIDEIRSGGDE